MYKFLTIPVLVLILLVSAPQVARAEGNCGFFCQLFGWDAKTVERTEIREDAATQRTQIEQAGETERKRLDNERMAEQTRLENEQAARIHEINRQADLSIEQARSNATIAQAEKDKYVAYVENWRQSQVELARFETDKALAAFQGQTDLGLKAITEAGKTKRWALTTDLIWSVVLIVGLVLLGWYFLKKQGETRTIQILPGPGYPNQLPPGYGAQLSQKKEPYEITYYDQR